ncbi:hypothetical protein [Georgenia faecalis]|uniref:DNA-binding protein n=1 Tax=Georgenia faecalis TaxID=2483799 RepID=A0ABV9D940_9MICO|nr:hypothetical protein [Georgenia faecalis]
MFVVTIDQKASRSRGDGVPGLLRDVDSWTGGRTPFALPLERTVGDEVQGVLTEAAATVALALHVQRLGGWSVGIGAGPVDLPLAGTSRESSGPAFIHARTAVERARGRTVTVPLAVDAPRPDRAEDAEAVLQMLVAVRNRRTRAGWDVVDRLAGGATQRAVAADLGISEQAVSQRLRVALWEEERRLHPLAARLLEESGSAGAPA